MKDYYAILGVAEGAAQDEIRSAFRRLAFQHHPDTNPGNERQAEERFKEINEAYGVLGDAAKRRQYDMARRSPFAGAPGFAYSQQDIFRDAFANQAAMNELNRMFRQAGLRFDQDFLNRVFFSGGGLGFQAFTGPGPARRSGAAFDPAGADARRPADLPVRRPGFISRLLARALMKFLGFLMQNLFGLQETRSRASLDRHVDFEVTADEAAAGAEKPFAYRRGTESKRLMVKVPAGVQPGTEIRLRGMGIQGNGTSGDLYLRVRVKG
jgi:DnaJ-class molecular chaperone